MPAILPPLPPTIEGLMKALPAEPTTGCKSHLTRTSGAPQRHTRRSGPPRHPTAIEGGCLLGVYRREASTRDSYFVSIGLINEIRDTKLGRSKGKRDTKDTRS